MAKDCGCNGKTRGLPTGGAGCGCPPAGGAAGPPASVGGVARLSDPGDVGQQRARRESVAGSTADAVRGAPASSGATARNGVVPGSRIAAPVGGSGGAPPGGAAVPARTLPTGTAVVLAASGTDLARLPGRNPVEEQRARREAIGGAAGISTLPLPMPGAGVRQAGAGAPGAGPPRGAATGALAMGTPGLAGARLFPGAAGAQVLDAEPGAAELRALQRAPFGAPGLVRETAPAPPRPGSTVPGVGEAPGFGGPGLRAGLRAPMGRGPGVPAPPRPPEIPGGTWDPIRDVYLPSLDRRLAGAGTAHAALLAQAIQEDRQRRAQRGEFIRAVWDGGAGEWTWRWVRLVEDGTDAIDLGPADLTEDAIWQRVTAVFPDAAGLNIGMPTETTRLAFATLVDRFGDQETGRPAWQPGLGERAEVLRGLPRGSSGPRPPSAGENPIVTLGLLPLRPEDRLVPAPGRELDGQARILTRPTPGVLGVGARVVDSAPGSRPADQDRSPRRTAAGPAPIPGPLAQAALGSSGRVGALRTPIGTVRATALPTRSPRFAATGFDAWNWGTPPEIPTGTWDATREVYLPRFPREIWAGDPARYDAAQQILEDHQRRAAGNVYLQAVQDDDLAPGEWRFRWVRVPPDGPRRDQPYQDLGPVDPWYTSLVATLPPRRNALGVLIPEVQSPTTAETPVTRRLAQVTVPGVEGPVDLGTEEAAPDAEEEEATPTVQFDGNVPYRAGFHWVAREDLPVGCPYPYPTMPVPTADYRSGRWLEADYVPSVPLPPPFDQVSWQCGVQATGPLKPKTIDKTRRPYETQRAPPSLRDAWAEINRTTTVGGLQDYGWVDQRDLPTGCPYPYLVMPVPIVDYRSGAWLQPDYLPSRRLPAPFDSVPWQCSVPALPGVEHRGPTRYTGAERWVDPTRPKDPAPSAERAYEDDLRYRRDRLEADLEFATSSLERAALAAQIEAIGGELRRMGAGDAGVRGRNVADERRDVLRVFEEERDPTKKAPLLEALVRLTRELIPLGIEPNTNDYVMQSAPRMLQEAWDGAREFARRHPERVEELRLEEARLREALRSPPSRKAASALQDRLGAVQADLALLRNALASTVSTPTTPTVPGEPRPASAASATSTPPAVPGGEVSRPEGTGDALTEAWKSTETLRKRLDELRAAAAELVTWLEAEARTTKGTVSLARWAALRDATKVLLVELEDVALRFTWFQVAAETPIAARDPRLDYDYYLDYPDQLSGRIARLAPQLVLFGGLVEVARRVDEAGPSFVDALSPTVGAAITGFAQLVKVGEAHEAFLRAIDVAREGIGGSVEETRTRVDAALSKAMAALEASELIAEVSAIAGSLKGAAGGLRRRWASSRTVQGRRPAAGLVAEEADEGARRATRAARQDPAGAPSSAARGGMRSGGAGASRASSTHVRVTHRTQDGWELEIGNARTGDRVPGVVEAHQEGGRLVVREVAVYAQGDARGVLPADAFAEVGRSILGEADARGLAEVTINFTRAGQPFRLDYRKVGGSWRRVQ